MIALSTSYWGNIEYFAHLAGGSAVVDLHEHYKKQSYRNRCNIMTAAGVLALSIPVVKISGGRTPVKDIEIDYDTKWQKNHWRAIVSAYRNSPYFEHYEDIIAPFYHNRYRFLADYNIEITDCALHIMGVDRCYESSQRYIEQDEAEDLRDLISPKRSSNFSHGEYYQVFSEILPFEANLSLLDLIMCEGGAESRKIVENSICGDYQR